MKRGQVSYFILFGIIFLVIVGLLLYAVSRMDFGDRGQETNIQTYVDGCIDMSAKNAIKASGIEGFGYPDRVIIGAGEFALYKDGDSNMVPGIDAVQTALEHKVTEIFITCIDDFSRFHRDVEHGDPVFDVTINERDVRFDLDYTVEVIGDESERLREEFSRTLDINLKRLIEETRQQVDQMIQRGMYNMSYYAESHYNSTAMDYSEGIIFDIRDDDIHLVYAVQ